MAPFRNRDRSNRSGRGPIEHNVLEGLPINQYKEAEITIGPNSADLKPVDKDAWPELPMPRDSHMLTEHSQQLLRAARSGKIYKPPAPPEDDNEMKDEEEENKEVQTGFTVKKYVRVARHLEAPEPEYLAKRRKGLPSPYVNGQLAQPALRETKIKKLDAEGNVAVYKVLVPEGQAVEGEVQPTDAAIEVAPATAAPGTIVEGVGVVNAEGVVVANDILHQQTPPRRRPPPPKKKRGGPGRGKKKVVFAEGATDQGTPTSNTGSDLPTISGLKQEDGSVAPSDGGDTPMADAGGDEEEGSGEEGSEDEDHDMERTSTPATPLQPTPAPTSAPELSTNVTDFTPSEGVAGQDSEPASLEAAESLTENELTVLPPYEPKTTELSAERDLSSSPDLPLSTISHSRQNSLNQINTSATIIEPVFSEPPPSQITIPVVIPEPEAALEPVFAAEPVSVSVPEPVSAPEPVSSPEPVSAPEPILAPEPVSAPEPVLASEPVITPEPVAVPEPIVEPAPLVATELMVEPVAEPEPESVVAPESDVIQASSAVPSTPPSEPDLLGSLERQLEKDSEELSVK